MNMQKYKAIGSRLTSSGVRHERRWLVFLLLWSTTWPIGAQTGSVASLSKTYIKREAMIPMRDGVKLYTAIYEPRDRQARHPILMYRTPYGSGPYGNEFCADLQTELQHYVATNYIIVYQDVRGCNMSEGQYENVRPVVLGKHERANDVTDAYDTAEWLVRHTYNNGCIGLTGYSYLGYYALTAALSNHPAIKAVCPEAPIADWFMGDDIHHNGALMLTDSFGFLWNFGRYRPTPSTAMPPLKPYYYTDEYSFFRRQGSISRLSALKRDSLPFWDQVCRHTNYDEWWQQRCPLKQYERVDIPVMIVGGLFDAEDLYGTWHSYKALNRRKHPAPLYLLMGPWSHGGWLGGKGNRLGGITFGTDDLNETYRNMQERFFDYYLRGEGEMHLPAVTLFFTGENRWRSFDTLPGNTLVPTPIYLHRGGRLDFEKPVEPAAFTQYVSDPAHPVPYTAGIRRNRDATYMIEDQRFASRRNDVLTFVTDPLQRDLTLCGAIGIDLAVSISTTDADFVVKLVDVFPDDTDSRLAGYEMPVRSDVMRGRYRNSFGKPQPFVPGKVEQVGFELPDVAHTFLKGHRLMVQVQSSWFPLVDLNPQQFVDIYRCTSESFVASTVTIHHDSRHTSRLLLPILK